MAKTTKRQFELFKKECQKWIKFFGLSEWDVYHSYEHMDNAATCASKNMDSLAVFALTTDLGKDILPEFGTDRNIRKMAFHEVCELMFARYDLLATRRFDVTEEMLTQERHQIIARLENSVFK